jgi:threonine dehydratase
MYPMELRDIYAARRRIRGRVRETPLEHSPFISELCGGEVWLKLENLQLTGSFKIRGALNKLLQLSDEERRIGVVAASSGNHGQGVGYVARELGVDATIVVPQNTPGVKREAIRRYGVELIVHGEECLEAERLARKMGREMGKTFVSPYNDLDIIAGQGTVGLEMVEATSDLDVVLVPVGSGGLISGVGCALKSVLSGVEVLGVQSVASPVMYESMRQGRIVEMELEESVAEGLHGFIEEDTITFDLCRSLVDDFILVREETIKGAIRLLLTRQRQVVEGAGAAGVAAIMEDPERFQGRRVGVVVSGGNLDLDLLREIACSGEYNK